MSGQEAFPALPDPPAPAPALPAPIAPVSKLQRGGAVAVQNCITFICGGPVAQFDHLIPIFSMGGNGSMDVRYYLLFPLPVRKHSMYSFHLSGWLLFQSLYL